MQIETINISEIKPYWRNPRRNEMTVEAIKESIKAYGCNSPLVLDKDRIIIKGHATYKALCELGHTTAMCVIADLDKKKAKAYRIADNKIQELSSWDYDALKIEIRELDIDDSGLPGFSLNELDMFIEELKVPEMVPITNAKVEAMTNDFSNKYADASQKQSESYLDFFCPKCGEEYSIGCAELEARLKIQCG